MRHLFLGLLLFVNILFAEKEKQNVSIGFGPYVQSQPYKSTSNIILPSPVIFFDNSLFYVRWSRAGIYFLGDKGEDFKWAFSLTAQPRTLGYKPSDSEILSGMDERKSTIEGGLAFSAKYKDTYIENMLLHDLLGYNKSWVNRTEIGTKYSVANINFYPSIVMLYMSDKFVDYYYGVKENEVNLSLNRPAYKAGNGFEFGVQTYIGFPIAKNFSALFNFRYDLLPKSAKNSPLVAENYIYSGLASILYNFEY
ncbi:MipA/OmpV family protein [Sulfurimonas marina]|uniref:MipA/OmpV family protein n=1 Tax=Sulfurimonas marina TaxID=2590551 RepID=A0A7M1AWY7_9BACT|nr:MipA/OmpV family protein [Sulfurimonas marina]QOP40882.1 MipA/OmpV family protein [Sulfurimonas marina]